MASRFLIVLCAFGVILAGCRDTAAGGPAAIPNVGEVRGKLTAVESSSLLDLTLVRVRDAGGSEWEFDGRDYRSLEFTPSHLREHMVTAQDVTVRYRRSGEALAIVEITD
ncbi:MAG: hypothetical protein FJ319_13785 [SAR202 cluster bacterium]|nr:hypothetical protein [SAR202 cluster bacterium]